MDSSNACTNTQGQDDIFGLLCVTPCAQNLVRLIAWGEGERISGERDQMALKVPKQVAQTPAEGPLPAAACQGKQ